MEGARVPLHTCRALHSDYFLPPPPNSATNWSLSLQPYESGGIPDSNCNTSPLTNSFHYLCQNRILIFASCFFKIQYYFAFLQVIPSLAIRISYSWFPFTFDRSPSLCFFFKSIFLLSEATKSSRLTLCISSPSFVMSHFSIMVLFTGE
jgi:hypothetical protein